VATPKHFPVRLGIIGGGQLARVTAIVALEIPSLDLFRTVRRKASSNKLVSVQFLNI
jgi:phosphoribosylaminoimidazole carboxylase (NCAIR synthetase)